MEHQKMIFQFPRSFGVTIATSSLRSTQDFLKLLFHVSLKRNFNPPMIKPFRLTYLAKGGGGGGVVATQPLEILTIACLTLSLTDRPILGLQEDRLKVVNICKMHGTWGLEVVVL